ncbi:unnamed protein product [Paramecium sonneborni]|uniref:Uncharacterized protein n=1 Tax=Paramecium sonneborni TaxID=65129 RepID=A0A8S1RRZ7_9CILI|nr:unnamed protein product [Paramecium sonneborni]
MSDNLQVKQRRRNSPQEGEQDVAQRQENKYNKIQRNDMQAYVQQPKIKRNRDDQMEDPQEDDDEKQSDKFGGFVFTKTKNDTKKQYIYEPKKQQPVQQQKKEYYQKKDQPPKKKPEKKGNKQKEISIQQLGELEKLQQHLINCGISITKNQENQDSELVLPPDFNKPLSIPSQPKVAPPPGLVDKDKSSDFVDILNQLQDNDSDGQMNYDQHFSSSVLTRGAFPIQTQLQNQFSNQKVIPNNNQNFSNNQGDQKNKEKKKKNKKKKPKNNKNQQDIAMIKIAPFSFPQQQQMGRNNLPDPLNISGPTFTSPLGFPPPGMMGLGPQISPFNSNLLGAPQPLGFPPGPTLGMEPLDPTFPMGPNIGPMRINQMMPPKFNQMPNMNQMSNMSQMSNMNQMPNMNQMHMPMTMTPPPQIKKQSNKNNMMMQPPNQFDQQVFCPPMMPPSMGNQFPDFPPTIPLGQYPPNIMNSGPILGMPPMMQFDDDFDQNWMPNDGMIQMPTPIQVFSNQNFPNLSQVQHPDSYIQEPEKFITQTKKINDNKNGNDINNDQINQTNQNTDGQPRQRKKLKLNSKPFYPINP